MPTIAGANADINIARARSMKMEGVHATDFIWAVRLAKVHKSLLSTDWSIETYSRRAIFNSGGEEVDVTDIVAKEGLEGFTVIEDKGLDQAFVI